MMNFGTDLDDWMKETPLHPDLEPFVRKGTVMGTMVHSPLVIQPLYSRDRCSQINGLYEQKLRHVEEAIKAGDFERAVMLHERPYRFDALGIAVGQGLTVGTAEYWSVVGRVWIDSENIHENFKAWRELWKGDATHRHHAMSDEDREAFSKLPDRIRVYRGYSMYGTKMGLSWSIERERAIWFAHRFAQQIEYSRHGGTVGCGYVAKENVLAYMGGRGESEIVIDPSHVEKWEYCEI